MFSVNRPQNPIKKVRIGAIFRGTSKRLFHNLFKIQAGSGFWNLDNTSKNRYHKVTKFEEVNHLMEKKGTRIAYFVALAIVVIALVIAKVANDGSGFVATGWALFPPIVAIALALISKEVYSSLFLGCVVGALLLANFQPWQMVVNFIGAGEGVGMINAIDISILIFLVILGIMVDLMNKAGGSAAFGRWAKKAVKTRSGAQLLTMLLGVLIFIDDYFNCLTVGAVMRPVTESHKISRAKLLKLIDNLTKQMQTQFAERFSVINQNFSRIFQELFGGGSAELCFTDSGDVLHSGIDIRVHPPGKIVSHIELLSGGEKALVAISLYFAIMRVNPPSFCMLDEIEAALDDVNVVRFANYLRRMNQKTQFIVITHRRGTMEEADMLYGVTMQDQGISKLLALHAHEAQEKLGITT